jgi:GNAT superfamily N-acetyltransferase
MGKDIDLSDIPSIPGLRFRRFRGMEDLPSMATVMTTSRIADGVDMITTVKDLTVEFENPLDFDPFSDILIAEEGGKMVGLANVLWENRQDGKRVYRHSVDLVPEWRGKGVREGLFRYNERHIQRMADSDESERPRFFELWANDAENEWKHLAISNGYQPIQHELDMVRNLDLIPDIPLPDGLEVRTVKPEDYREIWEAIREAWRQDWDYTEDTWGDSHFESFKKSSIFQPGLWQVAWDRDVLAGMVLNYIIEAENRELSRSIGHTEYVFVREAYRGRGLARALLARSFEVLKERGMDEAMLGLEVENPHGVLRLYEGMGFKTVNHFTWYQKPL